MHFITVYICVYEYRCVHIYKIIKYVVINMYGYMFYDTFDIEVLYYHMTLS